MTAIVNTFTGDLTLSAWDAEQKLMFEVERLSNSELKRITDAAQSGETVLIRDLWTLHVINFAQLGYVQLVTYGSSDARSATPKG